MQIEVYRSTLVVAAHGQQACRLIMRLDVAATSRAGRATVATVGRALLGRTRTALEGDLADIARAAESLPA